VFSIDQRLHIGADRATVRYVGSIDGQSGDWVGLEWDNAARGKHDGSVNGRRYFHCAYAGQSVDVSLLTPVVSPMMLNRPSSCCNIQLMAAPCCGRERWHFRASRQAAADGAVWRQRAAGTADAVSGRRRRQRCRHFSGQISARRRAGGPRAPGAAAAAARGIAVRRLRLLAGEGPTRN